MNETDLLKLGKPPIFSGEEDEWAEWSFTTKAYLALHGDRIAAGLRISEGSPDQLDNDVLPDEAARMSRKVFYILTLLTKGQPHALLRQIADASGYEAWRQLTRRYDSKLEGRQHVLLSRALKPDSFPSAALGWEDAHLAWKRDLMRWQAIRGEHLPQAIQISILIEHSPPAIRS